MPILTSDQVIGKKEDIQDKVFEIFPHDTPFVSSLDKRTIKNTYTQWLEKALPAPASIALVEGADAVDLTVDQPVFRQNNTQIIGRVIKVSRTADVVGKYGRATELAEGIVDAGIYCMNALEFAAVGSKQTTTPGSGSVAGFLASAQAQIDPSMLIKTGGTATPLSAANVDAALLALYRAGGKPKTLMITPEDASTVAAFTNAAGRYRTIDGDSKTVTNAVNLYVGPNGTVSVVQNRVMATTDSIIYNPENWKLLVLTGWTRSPLAKVGDSERMQIIGEYSLQHENYKASALIRRAA